MVAVLCITIISIISMIICVMFFPILKIGKFQMQTFWFEPFLGAILILICGLIDPQFVFSSLIALTCGGTLLTFIIIYCLINRKEMFILKESLLRLPYNLIPLLLSMFVIVLSLHVYKISEHIYDFLNTSQPILSFGLSSFLSANFINNIPMSVLFVDIISNFTTLASHEAIYASIIGSNIAAFFTPIGALAGMMWIGILKQNGVKFTFLKLQPMVLLFPFQR